MFDNCVTFNEDESPVGQAGHNLRAFFETKWDEYFDGASLWNWHLIQTKYLYKLPISGRHMTTIYSIYIFLHSIFNNVQLLPNDRTTHLYLIAPHPSLIWP